MTLHVLRPIPADDLPARLARIEATLLQLLAEVRAIATRLDG